MEPSPSPDLQETKMKRKEPPNPNTFPKLATVIALDPGGTTGWALWSIYPEALSDPEERILGNIHLWTHGQVDCEGTGNLGSNDADGDRALLKAAQTPKGAAANNHDVAGTQTAVTGYTGRATTPMGVSNEGEAIGVAELVGLLRSWEGSAVVIEDFILRQFRQDRALLSPVRVTAAISQWLWQQRRGYFIQQPAMAKTTATDARLKTWGIYQKSGGMQHARDADRHAITFLRRAKADPAMRAKAWPHLFDTDGSLLTE